MPGIKELKMVRGALQGLTGTGNAAKNMLALQEARNQIERRKEIEKQKKKKSDSEIALNEMKLQGLEQKINLEQKREDEFDKAFEKYIQGNIQKEQSQDLLTSGTPFLSGSPISKSQFRQYYDDPNKLEKEKRATMDQTMQEITFAQKQQDRIIKAQKSSNEEREKAFTDVAKDMMDYVFAVDESKGIFPSIDKVANHPLLGTPAIQEFGITIDENGIIQSKVPITPYTLKGFLKNQEDIQNLIADSSPEEKKRFNSLSPENKKAVINILKKEKRK